MSVDIADDRPCMLGEGPLWHPVRRQLFWFDIEGMRLLSRDARGPLSWQFDGHVSAAGWIDPETLLIASESALFRFNPGTGERGDVVALEAGNPATRSNDGRADPWGGFWIGTMGKRAEPEAGAIYRYFNGVLERLIPAMTIPNAICFSHDRRFAFYTDTPTGRIMRLALDGEGWPVGRAETFVDFDQIGRDDGGGAGGAPDGAVVDRQGCLWVALWGGSSIVRFAPDGRLKRRVPLPARQPTCPAFGGDALSVLFVTTARQGLVSPLEADGATLRIATGIAGCEEYPVNAE